MGLVCKRRRLQPSFSGHARTPQRDGGTGRDLAGTTLWDSPASRIRRNAWVCGASLQQPADTPTFFSCHLFVETSGSFSSVELLAFWDWLIANLWLVNLYNMCIFVAFVVQNFKHTQKQQEQYISHYIAATIINFISLPQHLPLFWFLLLCNLPQTLATKTTILLSQVYESGIQDRLHWVSQVVAVR